MDHALSIIGGADGPTVIFVTGNPLPAILILAALVVAVLLMIRFFRNRK